MKQQNEQQQQQQQHPRQNQKRQGQGSTALLLTKKKNRTNNEQKQKVEAFSKLLQKTVSSLTIINSDEFKNAGQNWERGGYLNSFPCIQIFPPDANHPGLLELLE